MRFIAVFLMLLLPGCMATTRPEDAPAFKEVSSTPPGYVALYIYRPYNDIARGVWPVVFINDRKVVDLKNEAYTVVFAKPGHYTIRTERSTPLSGLGNVPGEFSIDGSERSNFLLFVQSYKTSTTMVGGMYASPSFTVNKEGWALVQRDAALSVISKSYFEPPTTQFLD